MIEVSGSSDDLIEIDGDIREEFYSDDDDSCTLAFSDGTVLHVKYDDQSMWRINRLAVGTATYHKIEASDPDGDYTDRVTLTGSIEWVVAGYMIKRKKEATE